MADDWRLNQQKWKLDAKQGSVQNGPVFSSRLDEGKTRSIQNGAQSESRLGAGKTNMGMSHKEMEALAFRKKMEDKAKAQKMVTIDLNNVRGQQNPKEGAKYSSVEKVLEIKRRIKDWMVVGADMDLTIQIVELVEYSQEIIYPGANVRTGWDGDGSESTDYDPMDGAHNHTFTGNGNIPAITLTGTASGGVHQHLLAPHTHYVDIADQSSIDTIRETTTGYVDSDSAFDQTGEFTTDFASDGSHEHPLSVSGTDVSFTFSGSTDYDGGKHFHNIKIPPYSFYVPYYQLDPVGDPFVLVFRNGLLVGEFAENDPNIPPLPEGGKSHSIKVFAGDSSSSSS